jgi:hypothetical protein
MSTVIIFERKLSNQELNKGNNLGKLYLITVVLNKITKT